MSRSIAVLGLLLAAAAPALGLEYVTIQQNGRQTELAGKLAVEAEDGGVMLLTPDGVLWPLPKEEIVSRRSDEKPFVPLSAEELSAKLTAELPAGFKIHQTKNYLICYNTSPAYAQWVGGLFERLNGAFYNYWTRRGVEMRPPQFPLVALVFDSKSSYAQHARGELGEATNSIIGYYSLKTNRMTMYDLTGVEEVGGGARATTAARINQVLSRPGAERTVATIVHEATHQLAFNSGLQVRYADIPMWVSEGLAIYFETPDLESRTGWRNIGGVNRVNLINYRKAAAGGSLLSLEDLLTDDKRFRDPSLAATAYAQAWALNYFLLKTRSEPYVKYLQAQAAQSPLVTMDRDERLKQFQDHLGGDVTATEADFLRFMRSVN
ncbi:MAG TPA: DUF1570 domain-containing protein [Pirellulaceae bacterium]|nr:DUF1570 domain-containing protein [Pirellulaceae bacterium]